MNNSNWEKKYTWFSLCSFLVSIPLSSIFVLEWIAVIVACAWLTAEVYIFLNFGVSTLVFSCLFVPFSVFVVQLINICRTPRLQARSRSDRDDDIWQQLGKQSYNPRKKKPKANSDPVADSDSGSIVFHESVIYDDLSFDVDQTKTDVLKLLKETSLLSGNDHSYKHPLNTVDESSLFDNLYESEVKDMLLDSSLFSMTSKNKELDDSLFDFSKDHIDNNNSKKAMTDQDKSLVSGVTWEQGQSMEESLGTYFKPTGLFDSSVMLKSTVAEDDCSLFSDSAAVSIVDKKTPKDKRRNSGTKSPMSKSTANKQMLLGLVNGSSQEDTAAEIENNNKQVNIFEDVMRKESTSDVVIPPELLSFLEGKTDNEKLNLLFTMANQTVVTDTATEENDARLAHSPGVSTKNQLLQAVLKKKLKKTVNKKSKKFNEEDTAGDEHQTQKEPHATNATQVITPSKDNMHLYRSGNVSYSGNVADNKRLLAPVLPLDNNNVEVMSGPERLEINSSYGDLDFAGQMAQFSNVMQSIEKKKPTK